MSTSTGPQTTQPTQATTRLKKLVRYLNFRLTVRMLRRLVGASPLQARFTECQARVDEAQLALHAASKDLAAATEERDSLLADHIVWCTMNDGPEDDTSSRPRASTKDSMVIDCALNVLDGIISDLKSYDLGDDVTQIRGRLTDLRRMLSPREPNT
jgi:hypothetical protein